jgi:hypothetical protein
MTLSVFRRIRLFWKLVSSGTLDASVTMSREMDCFTADAVNESDDAYIRLHQLARLGHRQ